MARYDVYRNPSGGYLLDLQSDLLDGLASRVVAPLVAASVLQRPAGRLNPVFDIDASQYVLLTQSMAAVPVSMLEKPVTSLRDHFAEITNAIDMVFHGF